MRSSDADILIIPGLGGSAADHWQTRWEQKLSTARRAVQYDWDRPVLEAWRARIIEEAAQATRPVVLVAHSLGALAVAHAAPFLAGKVAGGFLVAPPAASGLAASIAEIDPAFFTPVEPLPFRALVVASRDDPFSSYAASEELSRALGADLVDAGASGHINVASGFGPWPEGLMRFAGFIGTL
jgi:predicted alpha/beta hydrolase family esterase